MCFIRGETFNFLRTFYVTLAAVKVEKYFKIPLKSNYIMAHTVIIQVSPPPLYITYISPVLPIPLKTNPTLNSNEMSVTLCIGKMFINSLSPLKHII